ncbi:MBL fold metallo-hydrolase [Salinisphaera hydrothermalis]|uniref:MBL fold metallo-hydrolase n=1 Tax=Salinisphaera hydrothermalis TaxID=563188 RepID=UPI00333F73C2
MSESFEPPHAGAHFDGRRFSNPWRQRSSRRRRFGLWRWLLRPRSPSWPPAAPDVDAPDIEIPPRRSETPRITWIGHACVLIQLEGLNLITDPVYAAHVGPMPGIGVRRHTPPAIDWADLPPIDLVLISHAHYDHLDRATITALVRRDDPVLLAGLGLNRWLARRGSRRIVTLDWWHSSKPLGDGLSITAVPAQHWSRRGLFDRNRSLWAGFWIETASHRLYFAGDTGYGPHFRWIRERLGAPDFAMLPIGAYEPRELMRAQHMNPDEAVTAHNELEAGQSMGIHFATFKLTDEPRDQPIHDLTTARARHGLTDTAFIAPAFGQVFEL